MTKKKTKKQPLDFQSRPLIFLVPEELKKAHEELSWFFGCGEAECGIQSNFQAFLFAMNNKVSFDSAEEQLIDHLDKKRSQDSILKNIRKYRSVHNKFINLSFKQQQICEAFWREKKFDRSFEAHFGAGICLIPQCKSWHKVAKEFQDLTQLQYLLIHRRKLIDQLKKEVSELYLSALKDFNEK